MSKACVLMLAILAAAGSMAGPLPVTAVPIATGLEFPAAFTVAPDGRIFYGELFSGEIRIYDPALVTDTLFFQVPDILTGDERGLLGVALAPGFGGARPYVYAFATRLVADEARHQVVRVTNVGDIGSDMQVIWTSNFLAADGHHGGRILFGPDSKLYVSSGDARDELTPQDLNSEAGKMLRMDPTGAAPPSNPFGSRVWAYGFRNGFGFGFDPLTGYLWATENGTSCNDEVNRVSSGSNYGWGPSATCAEPPPAPANSNQDGPNPVMPKAWFTPTPALTGLAFCVGCGIPSAEGAMLFGSFNDGEIRQSMLSAQRTKIVSTGVVYTHPEMVLSMERGPDGAVYFSDSSGIWKLVQP